MSKETLGKLKECSKEFCDVTSTHGLVNISKSDIQTIRIVWVLLVLTAAVYCTYSTILSVVMYLNYDTTTSFKNVDQTITDFPAVTICNLNSFDLITNPYAATYIVNALKASNISPKITVASSFQTALQSFDIAQNTLSAYIMGDATLSNNESLLTREDVGFTLDTMLISCYFNGEQCTTDDFYWSRTYEYGNCYTFNGLTNSNSNKNSVKQTTLSGPNSGLRLELFVGVAGIQDLYSLRRGAFLVVHNNSDIPLVKYYGVKAPTGTATSIKLSRVFNSKLGSPFSTCRSDLTVKDSDSIYFKLISKYTNYKQRLCLDVYRQINIAIKYCNCNDPSLPLVLTLNTNICVNSFQSKCVNNYRQNTTVTITESDCPSECNTIDYLTSLDMSNYPASYYASNLKSQDNIISRFTLADSFDSSIIFSSGSLSGRKKRNSINYSEKIRYKRLVTSKTSTLKSSTNASSTSSQGNNSSSLTISNLSDSILMVSVFYSDLGYTLVNESPALDFSTLLGIIGGQFGLFLGASFLTFFEFLEFFFNIFRIIIKDLNNKENMRQLKENFRVKVNKISTTTKNIQSKNEIVKISM